MGEPLEPAAEEQEPEIVALELGDVVDLHGFLPRDVPEIVAAALAAAQAHGRRSLRLVHGRGIGVQRAIVRQLLARDPRVLAYEDAPAEAGGWGATCVTLR